MANCFWPRFYIVVLGIAFFLRHIYFFHILFGLLFPFPLWTVISLFYLDFYFLFYLGLLFPFLFSLPFYFPLFSILTFLSFSIWTFISFFYLDFYQIRSNQIKITNCIHYSTFSLSNLYLNYKHCQQW